MSRVSTMSPGESAAVAAIRLERVPLPERAAGLLYVLMFGLMLTVLWAMAESRSLEAKAGRILPAEPLELELMARAQRCGGGYAPTDRSTSSRVVTPSATSW